MREQTRAPWEQPGSATCSRELNQHNPGQEGALLTPARHHHLMLSLSEHLPPQADLFLGFFWEGEGLNPNSSAENKVMGLQGP